jgi:hypothetical protein
MSLSGVDFDNLEKDIHNIFSFANDPAGIVAPRAGDPYPNIRQLLANILAYATPDAVQNAATQALLNNVATQGVAAGGDKRANLIRYGNAIVGFLDEGGNINTGNNNYRTFIFPVTPGGKFTSSIDFPSNSRMMFYSAGGNVVGSQFGGGDAGNGGTRARTVYNAPAGAVFAKACVAAYYADTNYAGYLDPNLTFFPMLVIEDGDVQLLSWRYYEPGFEKNRNKWIGKRVFTKGHSFWAQQAWPLVMARNLGLASMPRASRGGQDLSNALVMPTDTLRNTNAANQPDDPRLDMTRSADGNTGANDTAITSAALEGSSAVILDVLRNSLSNNPNMPIGSITDASVTFDPNTGLVTNAGAGTFAAYLKGAVERYYTMFKGLQAKDVMLIVGVPMFAGDIAADRLLSAQEFVEKAKRVYGFQTVDVGQIGVNSVNADIYMDAGKVHPVNCWLRLATLWTDGLLKLTPWQ